MLISKLIMTNTLSDWNRAQTDHELQEGCFIYNSVVRITSYMDHSDNELQGKVVSYNIGQGC